MGVNEKITRELANLKLRDDIILRNNRVIDILDNEDITLKSIDAIQILRGTNNLLRELKC